MCNYVLYFFCENKSEKMIRDFLKKMLNTVKTEFNANPAALFVEEAPLFTKDSFIDAINKRTIYSG